ncbi:MAG: MliC family protein [Pasteurellaceae bacterium]|nr:MliC family protein [Pasteurellaceae bacterium]
MRVKFAMSILIAMALSACSITTIAPAEQVRKQMSEESTIQQQSPRTIVKKQPIIEYRCDKAKRVNVQPTANNKKNSTIHLTFNQSTYKLSPNVTNKGRKYSNIRWIWTVDNQGTGTLIDNRHKVLAKNCIKR